MVRLRKQAAGRAPPTVPHLGDNPSTPEPVCAHWHICSRLSILHPALHPLRSGVAQEVRAPSDCKSGCYRSFLTVASCYIRSSDPQIRSIGAGACGVCSPKHADRTGYLAVAGVCHVSSPAAKTNVLRERTPISFPLQQWKCNAV